ncbi:serine hydrolase [Gramella sp. GC03-9]|uniref:Serine hydrolase n=1 Tax=Christiangramia oceanisediminis TaxID=2920386 RepID=A0A9X2KX75_9FLAO|nr:serine hydrolase [Gramella oceanisediminis]MCP9198406.1 serine hydrolase [Gramella oceanisediminis]
MKHLLKILLLVLVGFHQNMNSQQALDKQFDSIAEIGDEYLSRLTELKNFNGVVLLKKGDEIVLRKAYNISRDTSSTLFVMENSQFDLRSVAKLFAKISVLKLEQEQKINRKHSISEYIPDFPNGAQITIEHLMTNSSGLPREFKNGDIAYRELQPGQIIELAKKENLEFKPGSKEQYSNVGFQLLYYIIGEINGSSFHEYLEEQVFKPLGMHSSGSNFGSDENLKNAYAFGHYLGKDKEIICECAFPSDEMRMGNLYSTVGDLDSFLAHLNKEDHQDLIVDGSISHAGGTRGKRAYIERNFADDYSIVFLANYDAIPFEQLVKDLQDILNGKSVEMPKAIERKVAEVPVEILKKYEGTYDLVDAGHIMLTIRLENDNLYVYQKGENNGILYPENETTFFGDKNSKESVEFVQDENGDYYMLLDFQGVQWKGIKIE